MKNLFAIGMLSWFILSSCNNQTSYLYEYVVRGNNWEMIKVYRPKPSNGFVYINGGTCVIGKHRTISPSKQDTSILQHASTDGQRISVPSFYIQQTEVSNNEYRLFVDWVRDSIGLTLLADQFPEHGFRKKDGRLNWDRRSEVGDSIRTSLQNSLAIAPEDRIYRRIEFDVTKCLYLMVGDSLKKDSLVINVYPDTMCWEKQLPSNMLVGQLSRLYFSHPFYGNHPVVGVSFQQAKAYAHWKTQMDQAQVAYRLPTEREWDYMSIVDKPRNPMPRDSKKEIVKQESVYPWPGLFTTDKEGYHLANYGVVKDESGAYHKYFIEKSRFLEKHQLDLTQMMFTTAAKTFPSNENGVFDIAGNVAEWVMDVPVNTDDRPYYLTAHADEKILGRIYGSMKTVIVEPGIIPAYHTYEPYYNRFGEWETDSTGTKKWVKKIIQASVFREKMYSPTYDESGRLQRHEDGSLIKSAIDCRYAEHLSGKDTFSIGDYRQFSSISDTVYITDATETDMAWLGILNRIKKQNLDVIVSLRNRAPRIVKGGSWYNSAVYMMSGSRQAVSSEIQSPCIGFRLAQTYFPVPVRSHK